MISIGLNLFITIPYVHKLQDEIDEGVWGGCP